MKSNDIITYKLASTTSLFDIILSSNKIFTD